MDDTLISQWIAERDRLLGQVEPMERRQLTDGAATGFQSRIGDLRSQINQLHHLMREHELRSG